MSDLWIIRTRSKGGTRAFFRGSREAVDHIAQHAQKTDLEIEEHGPVGGVAPETTGSIVPEIKPRKLVGSVGDYWKDIGTRSGRTSSSREN